MNNIWILAEAGDKDNQMLGMEEGQMQSEVKISKDPNEVGGGDNNGKSFFDNPIMLFMLPLLLVYMFFMLRGPKKKQQEHKKMVSSLSKNDRVRTIGGIFGTVLDIRDDEIVLKIDESTNTKMRVSPQAIATVLTDKKE